MAKAARIVDTSSSPKARLNAIPIDAVELTDGHWGERSRQNAETTLRRLWELLADPEAGHVLENFRVAASLIEGKHRGTAWQDEWLYKWLEAAACVWRLTGDKWIEERMDESIELIAAAQEDDGYISTQVTAPGVERFREPRDHEVYNMGHLLTAGVTHRRMTGKETLFTTALKTADFLCRVIGVTVEACFAHNPSAIMGLVEIHRETGDHKYLECAKTIVDGRGKRPKRGGLFNMTPGIAGTDIIQDRVPLRRETDVVGHNVFFTYLYAGAADVYLETGDESLREALERLWRDLTQRKISVNGGVSPMGHGLSLRNDPVVEAVGAPYFIPSADAYNETCGQIGAMMWNYRMLCFDGDAAYADVMELEIFNGVLSGIGLDGKSWWYRNALRRYDASHKEHGHNDLAERVEPGEKRICCPSNLVRTVAEWQTYLYGVSDDGVWIHHYAANKAAIPLADGATLGLEQTTDYPWDGRIAIAINDAPSRAVAVRLRIPGWAEEASVTINGGALDGNASPGGYCVIEREWKRGDTIILDLPMPVRLIQAHPRVEQLVNQVAIARGPILYCVESVDMPDVDLTELYAPSDLDLKPVPAGDLAFGALALEGKALHRDDALWDGQLYRPMSRAPFASTKMRMIPYFTWANRGPTAMAVWLPVVWR